MTIQTKFDPGDEVFVVLPHIGKGRLGMVGVEKVKVFYIKIEIAAGATPVPLYTVRKGNGRTLVLQVTEALLRRTKAEADVLAAEEYARFVADGSVRMAPRGAEGGAR